MNLVNKILEENGKAFGCYDVPLAEVDFAGASANEILGTLVKDFSWFESNLEFRLKNRRDDIMYKCKKNALAAADVLAHDTEYQNMLLAYQLVHDASKEMTFEERYPYATYIKSTEEE